MKPIFSMNQWRRAVIMLVSLFTIVSINTASAAEGDEIQVAKIEAWVKGIADPDHSGYYFFSKSKLMTNVIFARMNKNSTPDWENVAGSGTNKTADLTLPTGDEETCGLTGWDGGQITAGWWDYGNIHDPANWYLDASNSQMDHTSVDWYAYTWLENVTLTEHEADDPTDTDCGNYKYYTYDSFFFLDDGNGSYTQVDEDATIAPKGEGVKYIDKNGDTRYSPIAVEITSENVASLTSGWYVTDASFTSTSDYCQWSGDIHLILKDGVKLRLHKGLKMGQNSSLTIYGQSDDSGILDIQDEGHSGALVINSLTVNGGELAAEGDTGCYGISAENITINKGTVYANGGSDGGTGLYCSGSLTVNGGELEANGENNLGIYASGTITVNGGMLVASGDGKFSGIQGADIVVDGGELYAYGGNKPGDESNCGLKINNLTVRNDGEVCAYGKGTSGIGIRAAESITIDDSEVHAYGGNGAESVGIDAEKNFTVTGGYVSIEGAAKGLISENITISDGIADISGKTGIYGSSATISGGGIVVTGEDYGITCIKLEIKGGQVYVDGYSSEGGSKPLKSGFVGYGVSITGGEVEINGETVGIKTTTYYDYLVEKDGKEVVDSWEEGTVAALQAEFENEYNVVNGISLSWTNETEDYFYASSYVGTVTVAEGKCFITDKAPRILVKRGTISDNSVINGKTLVPCTAIPLADQADNTDLIASADGVFDLPVILQDRTLYKDGKWNTLCLPFDLVLDGSPLADATVMELDSDESNLTDGTLTLKFKDVATKMIAGTPYIIKWGSGDNLVSPTFTGVVISKTMNDVKTSDDKVTFKGNYAYQKYTTEDKSILLVGTNNNNESILYWPNPDLTDPSNPVYPSIGAFRAFFQLNDGTEVREIVLNFGDDDSTGIFDMSIWRNGDMSNGAWFTLDGRKFQGKPTKPGLYIHNGRKVVVK